MNEICFIANYHLTPLQIQIAKGLEILGIRSCWIVVNQYLLKMVVDAGFNSSDVLFLRLPEVDDQENYSLPIAIKPNDILTADRALRTNPTRGLVYIHQSVKAIYNFLDLQRPRYVFGEVTWAHERIAAEICRQRTDMKFLCPHTVRFPAGRWGFFIGQDQSSLFKTGAGVRSVTESIDRIEATTPYYVKINNELLANAQTLRARIGRIKRFVTRENISPRDPTHIQSRWDNFCVAGLEELNRFCYRFVRRIYPSDTFLSSPFVLVALHKQPESSIDVYGRYNEDQWKVIHSIWRTLPAGWKIFVKEHSNAIGDRSLAFYHRVSRLPNAYLIHENASTVSLIRASQAVFTVSGTIAYEAALLGKASFTFAPMFFNRFAPCKYINNDALRDCGDLRDLISASNPDAIVDAEDYILSRSFAGVYSDVKTVPSVMHADNINKLVSAFQSLFC